jgi:hypothetical protein
MISIERSKQIDAFMRQKSILGTLTQSLFCYAEVLFRCDLMNGPFVLNLRKAHIQVIRTALSVIIIDY